MEGWWKMGMERSGKDEWRDNRRECWKWTEQKGGLEDGAGKDRREGWRWKKDIGLKRMGAAASKAIEGQMGKRSRESEKRQIDGGGVV